MVRACGSSGTARPGARPAAGAAAQTGPGGGRREEGVADAGAPYDPVYPLAALLEPALRGYPPSCELPLLPAAAGRLRDALGLSGAREWQARDIEPLLRVALDERGGPLLGDLAALITETRRLGVMDLSWATGAMLDSLEKGLGVRWPDNPDTVTEKLRACLSAGGASPAARAKALSRSPFSRVRRPPSAGPAAGDGRPPARS